MTTVPPFHGGETEAQRGETVARTDHNPADDAKPARPSLPRPVPAVTEFSRHVRVPLSRLKPVCLFLKNGICHLPWKTFVFLLLPVFPGWGGQIVLHGLHLPCKHASECLLKTVLVEAKLIKMRTRAEALLKITVTTGLHISSSVLRQGELRLL